MHIEIGTYSTSLAERQKGGKRDLEIWRFGYWEDRSASAGLMLPKPIG